MVIPICWPTKHPCAMCNSAVRQASKWNSFAPIWWFQELAPGKKIPESDSYWRRHFDVAKPCSRCIFTTVSPEKGQKHPSGEPLATLQTFRTAVDNGDVDFGQNLIARNSGVIRVGDEVEILATGPARAYGAAESDDTAPEQQPDATVLIDWQGQTFRGNNQQVLLEQLENRGIRVPYSCRAGICGCCRIRLVDGEVSPLKKSAMGTTERFFAAAVFPKRQSGWRAKTACSRLKLSTTACGFSLSFIILIASPSCIVRPAITTPVAQADKARRFHPAQPLTGLPVHRYRLNQHRQRHPRPATS